MRLSPEQNSRPNSECLNTQKSREGSSLKEIVSQAEKPSQPRLSLCSKIKRAVQSKGDCLASRKASLTAAVSMLKNQGSGSLKVDCVASRNASPTVVATMLKNQESDSV